MIESMCPEGFTSFTDEGKAWEFLLDLADKTREWESTQESERTIGGKGYFVDGIVAKEAHLDSLIKRIEAIVPREPSSVNLVKICAWCQSPGHVIEECPNTSGGTSNDSVNALYQNNPYSNTYNPGWRNHPNFSWNQGNQVGPSNFYNQGQPGPQRPPFAQQSFSQNTFPRSNVGPQASFPRAPLLSSYQQPPGFTNIGEASRISDLKKNMALLMTSHQNLTRELTQVVSIIREREKGTLPSQPEPNPMHHQHVSS